MITLIARSDPDLSCSAFLSNSEWKILNCKILQNDLSFNEVPTIDDAVKSIAILGGYLDRKGDGPPGIVVLWRGWKRLMDLVEGWEIAQRAGTYG